jgi:hypothetical protein
MATARTFGAMHHHVAWMALVPLVLVGDIVVASLAWWLVGLILK